MAVKRKQKRKVKPETAAEKAEALAAAKAKAKRTGKLVAVKKPARIEAAALRANKAAQRPKSKGLDISNAAVAARRKASPKTEREARGLKPIKRQTGVRKGPPLPPSAIGSTTRSKSGPRTPIARPGGSTPPTRKRKLTTRSIVGQRRSITSRRRRIR